MPRPTHLLLGALLTCTIGSCKKETAPPLPAPTAGFEVVGTAAPAFITVGTYDPIQVTNTSANAVSYQWTLGDSTKAGVNPGVFSYPKAGTYTLTLRAQNANGQQTTVSRQVRVLDRVLKQIVIVDTRFENVSPPHPLPDPTVRVVLRLGPNHQAYPTPTTPYASYDAPILFQGPLLQLTTAQLPYSLDVPGRLVLDYPALNAQFTTKFGYTGIGYGLELYAQDASGTYLASSSYQALYRTQAGNISILVADVARNRFVAQYSNVQLICAYE